MPPWGMPSGLTLIIFSLVGGISGIMAQECTYLVFSDEFDYQGEPNPEHWNYETGGGGWGNNELQTYTDSRDNSYVTNGTLKIHARKSLTGVWTSARMVTSGKVSWKYGKFEIRAKLPHGVGTWPAIWMMPQNSVYGTWPKSGEIDIMEHVGYDPGIVHGSVHTEAFNHKDGTQKSGSVEVPDAQVQFHVYGIEWTPDEIKWFVDGEQYYSFSNLQISYKEWPFDQPFFLILNIAIGGDWGGAQGIDPNLEEAIMEVDYVRVYKTSLPDFTISGPSLVQNGEEVTFSVPSIEGVSYEWSFPEGVDVISGNTTSEITVQWGNRPGNVECKMISECDEKSGAPLSVDLKVIPDAAPFVLSALKDDGSSAWEVPDQSIENNFSLQPDGNGVRVDFSISDPAANPKINLPIGFTADFEEFRNVRVALKILDGDAPGIMRFDFIDSDGRVNTADLFKISDPVNNNHFHIYEHRFVGSSSSWNMHEITEVRLYVNYGITGRSGEGTFVLSDIQMAPDGFFVEPVIPDSEQFMLTLNTGNDGWQVSEPLSEQIALSGGESLHIAYSGIEASENNYIKIKFPNPVDLHAFGQINMEFVPGGDFPQRMKTGLIDENGILNENDLFVVSDFFFVDQNENILTYDYGKVDDGGEFLPCRISEIRIWLDSDEGNSDIVDFSISDIYFSELDFGSGIFNELHYESIRLWPNPVKDYVFFDQNNEWFDRWQIYNLTGKIVSAGILNNFQERIRLSGLSSGLYFLKLYNKQGNVRVGKFFVK